MNTSKQPKVCVCDDMPYIHNYGAGCGELNEFVPTEEEVAFQNICKHVDGEDEEGSSFVIEGVCGGCGKVVNKEEATRWQKKD